MKNSKLVYSTETGRIKPETTTKQQAGPPGDGIVRLCRQTKGKKGKGVTIITGLPLETSDLKKMAAKLKQKFGCGGSVKDGNIEIQGDKRDLLEKELVSLGYRVKRSGG